MNSWESSNVRDYHEEFKPIVECRDPMYKPHHTTLWTENVTKNGNTPGNQLIQADQKIETIQVTQNKLQFDADALTLARDASLLANLYKQQMKSERAQRLAKVMHIKQQNQIGSGIVVQYMEKNSKHVSGPMLDLALALDKDRLVFTSTIEKMIVMVPITFWFKYLVKFDSRIW